MAAELTTKYVVDSIEGNSLITTVVGPESGWVEHCNQRGQLFYADAVSEEFYKKCHQQAIDTITKHGVKEDKKNLGFMKLLKKLFQLNLSLYARHYLVV